MLVISESLHRQRYKFLWDLIFERHPHGAFIRGKWEGQGEKKTDIPPDTLLLELLRHQPTALILDEFQTWYDGLVNSLQQPSLPDDRRVGFVATLRRERRAHG